MGFRPFKFVLIAALSVGVTACVSGPTVYSDYDAQADFASYRTFGYMSPLGTDRAGYETLVTERLRTATMLQMEQKGYTYTTDEPDLLVNFQLQVQHREDWVPPPPMPWGPDYYGYRMGWYGPWAGYGFGPQMIRYSEGVINVDLIDARRKMMVWEGVATSVLDDAAQAKSPEYIDALVSDIFARYPFLAGSNIAAEGR